MSAETDFRAACVAHAPLTALVGTRITLNAADQVDALPYVVFTASHERLSGLTGVHLGDICTFSAQCWGRTAVQAAAVADALIGAMNTVYAPVTGRASGYDAEVGADAEVLTIEWLTG